MIALNRFGLMYWHGVYETGTPGDASSPIRAEGRDSRLRGNDVGGRGNDVGGCGNDGRGCLARACAHEFPPHFAAFCRIVSTARWIPAFAGMTWMGVGMTWVIAGMTRVGVGMTRVGVGMTRVGVGMTGGGASRACAHTRISVGFCRILSNSVDSGRGYWGLQIEDWGLHGVSLGCGLDGVVWIRLRFRVVREFCFVKYGAVGCLVSDAGGEIPAFAGMTWEGAGVTGGDEERTGVSGDMTWEGAGMTEAVRGSDVVGAGMMETEGAICGNELNGTNGSSPKTCRATSLARRILPGSRNGDPRSCGFGWLALWCLGGRVLGAAGIFGLGRRRRGCEAAHLW